MRLAVKMALYNNKQKGLALLTIMIFLLIITMIGLSSMQISSIEQMMAGNTQEINKAFQIAESGLVAGAKDLNFNASYDPDLQPDNYSDDEDYQYRRVYLGNSGIKRSEIVESVKRSEYANYQIASQGSTGNSDETLTTVNLQEGLYIITSKLGNNSN